MSFFSPAEAPAPAGGGLEILRAVAVSRKMGLASLAHELGTSAHLMEAFIAGGMLPIKTLNGIAALAFGTGVTYDSEVDLLRRAPQPEPPPFATVTPPQWNPAEHPPVDRTFRGFTPVKPEPPRSDPMKRPGWA